MPDPDEIDWAARRRGCVIDFSLPGDAAHLDPAEHLARIRAYYAQVRAAMRRVGDARPPRYPPADWPRLVGYRAP